MIQNLNDLYRGDPNEPREFDRNTVEGLGKSVSKCHDVNQRMISEQIRMQAALSRIERWKLMVWIATGAAAVSFAIALVLLAALLGKL